MSFGYFIVLEGLDGSGKSLMAEKLLEWLTANNVPAIHTREVGGSIFAEQARDLLLSMHDIDNPINKTAQALLISAARHDHVAQTILPALHDGKVVICERYYFSTLVYQHGADHLDEIVKIGSAGVLPDKVIYLETTFETVMERIGGKVRDKMDLVDDIKFHNSKRLLEKHLGHFALDNPGALASLDADKEVEMVFADILGVVCDLLNSDIV